MPYPYKYGRRNYSRRSYAPYARSYGPKRQVWKICRNIVAQPTTTQSAQDLYSATDSNINRTLTGLKLEGGANFIGSQSAICAIVRVPETTTALPLSLASGTDVYPVDEHVLWSAYYTGDQDTFYKIEIDSKAMRKMRPGDKIQFLSVSNGATSMVNIAFTYTMFLKD